MSATVMGILNVTPDSFSDGGHHLTVDAAVAHGRRLAAEGAGVIDIGGESTRPGAEPVAVDTELDRVVPVVEALWSALVADGADHIELSVDTTKAAVARAAVAAGASIVNDVSASLEAVAADLGAGWIAMHAAGPSATMQDQPRYHDVRAEVADHLADAARRGTEAGVTRLWVDPGIGFGKTTEHNLALVGDLDRFTAIAPVVVGVSRKATIGAIHAESDSVAAVGADDRLEGSLAMATWCAHLGAGMVRVHDVRATVHAVSVVAA